MLKREETQIQKRVQTQDKKGEHFFEWIRK